MTTTARQTVRAAAYSALVAFQAANGTLLRATYTVRPNAMGVEMPGGFVGNVNETMQHTSGIRFRRFVTEVVLFDTFAPSNAEQAARLDLLVDAFVDFLTANPTTYMVGGIQEPVSVNDGELTIPGTGNSPSVNYRALAVGIGATIQEGRL